MKYLRTSDERFASLPDFPCAPKYLQVDDTEDGTLRVHYVDEGAPGGDVVLCLHGEPSWSFLYRRMIAVFAQRGYRVVAPDLVGFGRSDKPTLARDHSYRRHVAWMKSVVEQLHLRNVTLVCQDWGGLIGLRLVAESPELFRRVVTANTSLPTGEEKSIDAFLEWRERSQRISVFPVGRLISEFCARPLSDAVVAAYDAPFPNEAFKVGVRQLPMLVPTTVQDPEHLANKRAWAVLREFDKPWLTAFSDRDPITRHGERVFQRRIKGAQGRAHVTIRDAGHFLQEDKGPELAMAIIDFMRTT